MLEEAIRYPAKGDDALQTILIGGVLGLLGFLIIPGIVVQGYLLREMRAVVRGEEEPPVFDQWANLLVDGVRVLVVAVVYGLVPLALAVALLLTSGVSSGTLGPRATAPFTVVGLGVVMLLGLLIYYLVPASLANLAVEGDIGAAFDVAAVLELVKTETYLTAWLVSVGVAILTFVTAVVLQFTVVGIVAVPFVSFYANVAIFYLFARAYREVLGPAPQA